MEFRVDDHQYWPEDPKQDLHQEVENNGRISVKKRNRYGDIFQ